jgi:hypothetical protein
VIAHPLATGMARTRATLLAWPVVYALLGVLAGVTGWSETDAQAFDLLAGIPSSILIYLWCKADLLERRLLLPSGYTMFATLFAPLGLPVYLVRTRKPLRAALLAMGKALLLFLAASALMAGVEAVVQIARGQAG